ncbi:substrate-binding domain-containing protein [Petroclostridium sp. X23]|uniref:substrate-binding domain-containing protein n=1 Tax=Petroclostridium sp. X23 TaxID=3045146 RepID=UPI0024AC9B7F|nr:substrate-binding domain-containing protein [Petroclostridium sp. X23]WHH57277.1 substrate-binding domain-containing protein [Petroclostridium sp. X23]
MKRFVIGIVILLLVIGSIGCTSISNKNNTPDSDSVAVVKDKKIIAFIAPSQEILFFQWIKYGIEQAAQQAGYKVVTYDSHNSASQQAANAQTAITVGVSGVVLTPFSSASCPTVLNLFEENNIPVTFATIGPDPNVENYTSLITAEDYTAGYEAGKYLAQSAKELGGTEIGVLSLPLDRTNAINKKAGFEKACEEEGVKIVQILQSRGLTVGEAVTQAADMLTAHPNIKGIYGMYEQAGIGAVRVLETQGRTGKVAIVSSDGSPESINYVRKGYINGIAVQPAVGQGKVATEQLIKAINGEEVEKEIVLKEPLVTKENIDEPYIQQILQLAYPPSAGSY